MAPNGIDIRILQEICFPITFSNSKIDFNSSFQSIKRPSFQRIKERTKLQGDIDKVRAFIRDWGLSLTAELNAWLWVKTYPYVFIWNSWTFVY